MEREVSKVGIEFDAGCKVERIQITVGTEQEYSVEVTRDDRLYSQLEGLTFFEYHEEYKLECINMRRYVASKPKQGELKL